MIRQRRIFKGGPLALPPIRPGKTEFGYSKKDAVERDLRRCPFLAQSKALLPRIVEK